MDKEPDLELFIRLGFIEEWRQGDAKTTPRRRQHDRPETETDAEKDPDIVFPKGKTPVTDKPRRAGPGIAPTSEKTGQDQTRIEELLAYYISRLGRRSYEIHGVPSRIAIVKEALSHFDLQSLKNTIDVFATHPAYAFHRGANSGGKKYTGLCEYILAKGKRISVQARIEEILNQGGYEIYEDEEDEEKPQ